jgi:cation efflux family protein
MRYKQDIVDCCEDKSCALEALKNRQSGTLRTVLWINAIMFFVVLAAGLYASSSALLADSLDNLGDALTYALSLYAVGRGARTKGMVSLFKGILILGAALFVIAQIGYKLLHPGPRYGNARATTSPRTCLCSSPRPPSGSSVPDGQTWSSDRCSPCSSFVRRSAFFAPHLTPCVPRVKGLV